LSFLLLVGYRTGLPVPHIISAPPFPRGYFPWFLKQQTAEGGGGFLWFLELAGGDKEGSAILGSARVAWTTRGREEDKIFKRAGGGIPVVIVPGNHGRCQLDDVGPCQLLPPAAQSHFHNFHHQGDDK